MAVKDFAAFLQALIDFESGIDEKLTGIYRLDWNTAGKVQYFKTTAPGVPVYNPDGSFERVSLSYKEYFQALGVGEIYSADTPAGAVNLEHLHAAQFASTNFLGFIGYQLGESVLEEAGYYLPPKVGGNESYYVFPESQDWFANGKTTHLHDIKDAEGKVVSTVVGTRTNLWQGTGTGKDGINKFPADLRTERGQQMAIRGVMATNIAIILKGLRAYHKNAEDAANLQAYLGKDTVFTDPKGGTRTVRVTMSGLLAAAHLVGAYGVVDMLTTKVDRVDETGTHATDYLTRYADYSTIFDDPSLGKDAGTTLQITGTKWDETFTAGWSLFENLTIEGGTNRVMLHEAVAPGSKLSISGFVPGRDKIIVAGFMTNGPTKEGTTISGIKATAVDGGYEFALDHQTIHLMNLTAQQSKLISDGGLQSVFSVQGRYVLPWNENNARLVSHFDVANDVVVADNGMRFSQVRLVERMMSEEHFGEAPVTYYNTEIYAQGETHMWAIGLTLARVRVSALTAANFEGFIGGFSEITRV